MAWAFSFSLVYRRLAVPRTVGSEFVPRSWFYNQPKAFLGRAAQTNKMKIFMLRSAAATVMLFLLGGCSGGNDDSETCTVIACKNSGTFNTTTCGCDCTAGFTGSDCSIQIQPARVLIKKVRVTFFPNTDAGANWDTNGKPDIYYQIDRGASPNRQLVYKATTFYPDVLSTGNEYYEFTPDSPIVLDQPTVGHTFELLDYDGSDTFPNPDDQMGVLAFYPYSSNDGFPATIEIRNDALPLRVQFDLIYEW